MSWYKLIEIDEGILAVIDKDGGWFLSNSGLIDLGDKTVIIDTQYNEDRAAELKLLIQKLNLPSKTIIIHTHHHGDHIWGAGVFSPGHLLMHPIADQIARRLEEAGIRELYKQVFPHLDFSKSKYSPPTILVDEEMIIRGETRHIILKPFGPAHTPGDLIVEVDDVVFTGDILFNKVTPLAIDGTVQGWIKRLEQLPRVQQYVPGHGEVAGQELVEEMREYLVMIYEETRKAYEKGIDDPIKIGESIDLGPYKSWKHPERVYFNVERALMDLKDIPPGTPTPRLLELASRLQS